MIHHVSIEVGELERSGHFYDQVLGPLGWRRQIDSDERIAWGIVRPIFYVVERRGVLPSGGHVCFAAPGISAVKAAWEGGVAAGGLTQGDPGQRPEYGATYYSAYLRDPDGHRIEIAVGTD